VTEVVRLASPMAREFGLNLSQEVVKVTGRWDSS
jgi:hypothetical protein